VVGGGARIARRRSWRRRPTFGLVFLDQNGVEIDDPGEQLYDVMIGAATLRALVVPPSE
jgi:hypothetical protein